MTAVVFLEQLPGGPACPGRPLCCQYAILWRSPIYCLVFPSFLSSAVLPDSLSGILRGLPTFPDLLWLSWHFLAFYIVGGFLPFSFPWALCSRLLSERLPTSEELLRPCLPASIPTSPSYRQPLSRVRTLSIRYLLLGWRAAVPAGPPRRTRLSTVPRSAVAPRHVHTAGLRCACVFSECRVCCGADGGNWTGQDGVPARIMSDYSRYLGNLRVS